MKYVGAIVGSLLLLNPNAISAKDWEFKVITDPMSDAKRGIANSDGTLDAILVIKCDKNGPGSLYLSILSKNYLGKGRYGSRNIDYRFDGGEVESIRGYYDGRTASIFNLRPGKKGGEFLSGLKSAKEMVVRLSSYDYQTYTTVIDVTGAAEAIKKSADACGDSDWQ